MVLLRAFPVPQWWRICLKRRRPRLGPWVGKMPRKRAWQPTAVFLPGEAHGQRSLAGPSPRGHRESDTTEWGTCEALLICPHPVRSTRAGFIHGPLSKGFDSADGSQWLWMTFPTRGEALQHSVREVRMRRGSSPPGQSVSWVRGSLPLCTCPGAPGWALTL